MFCLTVVVSLLCIVSAFETSLVEDRIVGGLYTRIANYPFQVSFQRYQNHFCGGSLISTTYVLTAAHCIKTVEKLPLSMLQVRAGSESWISGGELRKVAAIESHPNYNADLMTYDVGLVKLESPFILTQYINTIKLATVTPVNGTVALISGWGKTHSGLNISKKLRSAAIDIISNEVCSSTKYSYSTQIQHTMICGVGIGTDSCQGDSGGPLVNKLRRELFGVISWGIGCANANYPGVYADVAVLRNWIVKVAGL